MSKSKSKKTSKSRKSSQRSQPSNPQLYQQVLKKAKATFDVWPSAYASAWVVREYKKRGGKYKQSGKYKKSGRNSKKPSKSKPALRRWFDEKWIDVCHLPKIVPCGRSNSKRKYPYCRPLKRVNSSTPRTARQLSKSEIRRRCLKKRKNPYSKVR